MQFTAVYKEMAQGYIGFVLELPGANTQGATLEEVRENLREAVEPYIGSPSPPGDQRLLGPENLSGSGYS